MLRYQGHLCVPNVHNFRKQHLSESHSSRYSILPKDTKMYQNLWEVYWYSGIKNDIAQFVAKWPNCQQLKIEHQKPEGLSKDINAPLCKCENLNMDFIVGLPRTLRQYDMIWVIVDRIMKLAHFIPIKVSYSAEDNSKSYFREMLRLNGVPLSIIFIVDFNSLLRFGILSKSFFVLVLRIVRHFTLKPIGQRSVLSKL